MASARGLGQCSPARRPHASSTASTRSRASARNAESASLAVEPLTPDLANAGFCRAQSLAHDAEALNALFENLERLVEIQVRALETTDDFLQPVELLGKPAHVSSTRAGTSPSRTRNRNAFPGGSCATRF